MQVPEGMDEPRARRFLTELLRRLDEEHRTNRDDVESLEARVAALEVTSAAHTVTLADHESRITALEP